MKFRGRIGRGIFVLALLLFVCGAVSCSWESVGEFVATLIPSVDYWEGKTASWSCDGTEVQYEVPQNVRTLNLTVNGAVDIFMVKMNTGSTVVPRQASRYIVSATAGSDENAGAIYSSRSALEENSLFEMDGMENVSGISASGIIRKDFAPARDFVPPTLDLGGSSRSVAGAAYSTVTEPVKSVAQIKPEVDKTTKELWVDSAAGYVKKSATLRAQGTNCYIWVLDECFEADDGSKITSTQAQELATQFDSMYQPIRDVFGNESDEMIHYNGSSESDSNIEEVSDTGKKVNIVVYDIEGDYKDGQQSGTLGYFWAKDYYTQARAAAEGNPNNKKVLRLTNEGKYFYVDSYFLNEAPLMLYSTLAHEFQHMINFGQKNMNNRVSSQTWSNEMMSMVCEDMVQDFLKVSEEASPISRLPYFCLGYYKSGLTDWLSDANVAYSYAGAYAFGAYLARNYGGKDLINQIATNQYVDQEAITRALKSIGKNETFESVFRKYAQALVLDNPPDNVNAPVPTFKTEAVGINGKMPAIDIFKQKVTYQDGSTAGKPVLLKRDSQGRVDLRPYGFTLHGVGYTESASTINLTFSSPVNDAEKVYILVQPHSEERWK